ncbi:hypothetical protein J7643_03005 [bacterium]|nr:hypothetical protein [bacterium]
MAQEASFARDLGYLDKFLTNLKTHAGSLAEPQRGELVKLLDEEVQRWDRIKALLSGVAVAPQETASASAPAVKTAPAQAERAGKGWTVGSLMPKA